MAIFRERRARHKQTHGSKYACPRHFVRNGEYVCVQFGIIICKWRVRVYFRPGPDSVAFIATTTSTARTYVVRVYATCVRVRMSHPPLWRMSFFMRVTKLRVQIDLQISPARPRDP